MQKRASIFFTIYILLFSSCDKRGQIIYIKIPSNTAITEKCNVKVLFRGAQIGEVREKVTRQGGYILLTAIIERKNTYKFAEAVYREDLLGNAYVELIGKLSEVLMDNRNNQRIDTLYGSYAPLYHEVDSASKRNILKEVGNFKNSLDSILENR